MILIHPQRGPSFTWHLEAPWFSSHLLGSLFLFIFWRFYLFIFREWGREGGGEGEKHQYVVASHAPAPGDLAPHSGRVPWLGIEPVTLWFSGLHSNHWATPASVGSLFLKHFAGSLEVGLPVEAPATGARLLKNKQTTKNKTTCCGKWGGKSGYRGFQNIKCFFVSVEIICSFDFFLFSNMSASNINYFHYFKNTASVKIKKNVF